MSCGGGNQRPPPGDSRNSVRRPRESSERCDTDRVIDEVSDIIRRTATVEVLARFRQLTDEDVHEKNPGDLVTTADRECELALIPQLRAVRDCPVVGEESVAADPDLMQHLGDDAAWLVDPVDGTANFVKGSEDFAVMVALLDRGVTVAAWIWRPVSDRMVVAELGSGAWSNGVRLSQTEPSPQRLSIIHDRKIPNASRERIAAEVAGVERLPAIGCAGVEYLELADGRLDCLISWQTFPWDHAPGGLIASEVGCTARRLDGSPYRPGELGPGIVTTHPAIWEELGPGLRSVVA